MAGGCLMQLCAYGAQDVYLTGNPQITFFKVVYRRYTNFCTELIEQTFNGAPDFGRRVTVTITRNGDLVTDMYLQVKLDPVRLGPGAKFGWVKRLGHALIHSVEIDIGGSKIDKQYGVWMEIWYQFANLVGQERGYSEMIGDVDILTDYNGKDKPAYVLYVPLQFWFNRNIGLALPLIALQYHEVRLEFEFTPLEALIVYNKAFKAEYYNNICMQDAQLLVNYVCLDSEERRRFAQLGHEYLIEQVQFTGVESFACNNGRFKLDFNHPTKALIWALRNGNYSCGKLFWFYSNYYGEWNNPQSAKPIIKKAARKLLRQSLALVDHNGSSSGSKSDSKSDSRSSSSDYCDKPKHGEWDEFEPDTKGISSNGRIWVKNNSNRFSVLLNTNSLKIDNYSLTDKISAYVVIPEFANSVKDIQIFHVKTALTIRDLSIPLECLCDTRAHRISDAYVNIPFNFGVLIDGSYNPVAAALIQFNGQDRFDKRDGHYFNYVQPWEHKVNTPAPGVNLYSFGVCSFVEHQPCGTANLSRIDNTTLQLWFWDPTQVVFGGPCLDVANCNNKLYIYGFSYNILRIMSGINLPVPKSQLPYKLIGLLVSKNSVKLILVFKYQIPNTSI